jgi:hypothetical protein
MRPWLRTIIIAALIFILVALDTAFFPAFGSAARHINTTLIASLYAVVILQERVAILIFVVGTLLVGFTASTSIVLPLASGLVALSLVNGMFLRFFTNRSYYTLLALGTIGWLTYYLLFDSIRIVFKYLIAQNHYAPSIDARWAVSMLVGFAALLVCLTGAYVLTVFFSKRFRSYFIVSDRAL